VTETLINSLAALVLNADGDEPYELNVLAAQDPAVVREVVAILADDGNDGFEKAARAICRLIEDYGFTLQPPRGDDEHGTDVVLHEVGPDADAVIEALRTIPEMQQERRTPEAFVAGCRDDVWPAINVPRGRAEAIKTLLQQAGAVVYLESSD
jgi:hypothetical protein